MLRCVSDRFRGAKGDQHGLGPQELHPLAPDLAALPISPPHGLSRNRRRVGWCITTCGIRDFCIGDRCLAGGLRGSSRRGRAWPEHGTHPSRLDGGARFLTAFAQRARTAMAYAGRIQHTQRAVALWSAFLHVQRMARRTAQRPIRLERKVCSSKSFGVRGACPVGRPVGRQGITSGTPCLGRTSRLRRSRSSRGSKRGRLLRRVGNGARGNGRRSSIGRGIVLGRQRSLLMHPRIGEVRHPHRRCLGLLPKL